MKVSITYSVLWAGHRTITTGGENSKEEGKCGNSREAINENRLEREIEKDGWRGWMSSEEGRMRGERCDEGLWRPQRQTEDQT